MQLEQDFARWARHRDPDALTRVFDATAGKLLLLASHLGGSGTGAEDLVQATFLAAMRRADSWDPTRPLWPWLATILQNEARMAKRARRRRPEVSLDNIDMPVDRDPARLAASLDAVEAVLREIDTLPIADRRVLRLRLVHGFAHAEIAHALEMPVGTVRSRLHRGLARLRDALPAGLAGLIGAVLAKEGAALAHIRQHVLAHVATRRLLDTGWWIMKGRMATSMAAAAGLLLLGSAGLLAWRSSADVPEPAPIARRSATPVTADAAAPEAVPAMAAAGEARRTATPAPGLLRSGGEDAVIAPETLLPLQGTILDPQQQPVAGAEVVVVEELGAGFSMLAAGREAEERGRMVTGDDGRFSLPVPFARRLRLLVRADEFAPADVEPCYAGEDRTIELELGGMLTVRTTDAETGEPVGGVALEGWRRDRGAGRIEGSSAADGTHRFDRVPPGLWVVDVTPPDHESQLRLEVEVRAGATARLDVALERGSLVFGTVTDADSGHPIADAEVSVGWTFEKVVRTDGAGAYRMQGAPGPGVSDIHVRAPGYARERKLVDGDAAEQRMDFALSRAGSVRGRVVDSQLVPQPGVHAAACADLGSEGHRGHSDWQGTKTGADGMFHIAGVVPGAQYTLFVRHRGRATKTLHLPGPIDVSREIDVGDVILEAPAVLVGRVVDMDGRPLTEANVQLQGTGEDCGRLLGPDERVHRIAPTHVADRRVRTDVAGCFRFADLAAGVYGVSANVAGGPEGACEGVRVAAGRTTAGVEIAIDLGASLAGTVVTEDGAPLPQHVSVMVFGMGEASKMHHWADVERDGSFRALGLDEGLHRVQLVVGKWVNAEPAPWIGETIENVAAGREDLRLLLRPAAFVSGQVLDAAGQPQQDISVVAIAAGGGDELGLDGTDVDGRFRVRVPREGLVDLRYGPGPPMPGGLVMYPVPETAKVHRAVRPGATDVVLELK